MEHIEDLFEDDECLMCDDCGVYYPKSALKQCRICKKIVCESCRKTHYKTHKRVKEESVILNYLKSIPAILLCFFQNIVDTVSNVISFDFEEVKRTCKTVFIAALVIGFLFLGSTLYTDEDSGEGAVTHVHVNQQPNPHIVAAKEYEGQSVMKTLYFDWRGTKRTVTAKIDLALYYGSLSGSSNINPGTGDWWVRKATDSQQYSLYEDILSDLREIQITQNLDSDEYAELIVSFVQSIPYDYGALASARYPIAVICDGMGDCDEKSTLLCGLLAHEGYDVALFDLPEINHMSAAIKAYDTTGYIDGYIYVESTDPAFIGEVPYFEEGTPDRYPEYYVVGSGKLQYLKYNEVERIVRYCERVPDFLDNYEVRTNVDVDRYNTYVNNYNYLISGLNAGDREKAYSLVTAYPLAI